MNEEEAYINAKRKVGAKLGFYTHLAVYVVVNAFLVTVNMIVSPGYLWFIWPLLGWGVGLSLHCFSVFVYGQIRERMIANEMKEQSRYKK